MKQNYNSNSLKQLFTIFLFFVVTVGFAQSQTLIVSATGETGSTGTNWSITGTTLNVTGSASIRASVIQDALILGDLTIQGNTTPNENLIVTISEAISYTAAPKRLLTVGLSPNLGTITISAALNINADVVLNASEISGNGNIALVALTATTFNTSGGSTFLGILSGAGAIEKSGIGTLTLGALNNFTGITTINNGVLRMGSANALQASSKVVVGTLFTSTASIDLNGFNMFRPLELAGYGTGGVNGVVGALTNSVANTTPRCGAITLMADTFIGGPNFIGISGVINGAFALTKVGGGLSASLTLFSNNIYTGITTIRAGTLQIGVSGNDGTTGSGDIVIDTGAFFGYNRSNQYILSQNISGNGRLMITSSGRLILTGTNTYAGGTQSFSGPLQLGNGGTTGTAGTGSISINSLTLSRSDDTIVANLISSSSGSSALLEIAPNSGKVTFTGSILNNITTTINSNTTLELGVNLSGVFSGAIINNGSLIVNRNAALTMSGVISGSGAFTKVGTGDLILSANNTYVGNNTITAGTLVLQNDAPNPTNKNFSGLGALRIQPTAASFTSAFSNSGWSFDNSLTSLTLGKIGNTANVTLASATTIAGPITVIGGALAINGALTATNANVTLSATTAITQTAAITANGLALTGVGTATLTNADNSINTISGGTTLARIGAVNFINNKALTAGTVGTIAGMFSNSMIELATSSGNLTLTQL